jgi:hypothetical protein
MCPGTQQAMCLPAPLPRAHPSRLRLEQTRSLPGVGIALLPREDGLISKWRRAVPAPDQRHEAQHQEQQRQEPSPSSAHPLS